MREEVGHHLLDVGVDAAALLDGLDDAGETVVEQDHDGRLTRDVGAAEAHGDADIGLLQRRRVVDAVTGDGDDLPHLLERRHDLHLVLGRDPGEDHILRLRQLGLEVVVGHLLEFDAGDDAHGSVAAHDADPARDGLCRETVVAGDHDDADAGLQSAARPRR